MDPEAERRRLARRAWPVVRTVHANQHPAERGVVGVRSGRGEAEPRTTLADEPPELLSTGTPSERVAMVHRLTLDAWAMAGRALPDYPRAEAPGRVIRRAP